MRVAVGLVGFVSGAVHVRHAHEESIATQLVTSAEMKRACGKKITKKFSWLQNPGAGMDPDAIKPFEKVLKDGYMMVACVKDSMYEHGDKFGNNKFSYKMGDIANSSIVHYNEHVAKEDREPMTHQVCFEFCRGIPDMGFFGVSNGRDCYCTTFYKPMASDSSECDAVCEGDNTLMCGGAKKNSIFGMHLCADTESDLTTAKENGIEVGKKLKALIEEAEMTAKDNEGLAGNFQKQFGQAGDPTAGGLMQDTKIWAGKVQDAAADASKVADALKKALGKVSGLAGKDFTKYDNAKAAEDAIRETAEGTEAAEEALESLQKVFDQVQPPAEDDRVEGSAKQFYPIMYFVDKEFEDVPSTCGGEQVAKPVLGVSMDHCAYSCDALPGKCVGYGYFQRSAESVCILYSKFKSVQYYTGCKSSKGPPKKKAAFMQRAEGGDIVSCQAKLQNFEGLSLKPKGNGKCDICLKEATKANRCYK